MSWLGREVDEEGVVVDAFVVQAATYRAAGVAFTVQEQSNTDSLGTTE